MRVNFIVGAVISAVVVSTVIVVMNQLRKGEPRLIQSVVAGVAVGITVVAVQHWQNKKKTNSDTGDSQ